MDSPISITLNHDLPDEQGNQTYVFTFRGKDWEINIVMTENEVMLFSKVRTAAGANDLVFTLENALEYKPAGLVMKGIYQSLLAKTMNVGNLEFLCQKQKLIT